MNKLPLPVHLLTDIRGFSILGQTSFGGYFKIILSWWVNDCPEILADDREWRGLSGMYPRDYERYKYKIEPVLIQSIEILRKYREERRAITSRKREGMKRAQAIHQKNQQRLKQDKYQEESKGNIVDKNTPVNPTFIKPTAQLFHEGWNLERGKSPNINKKGTIAPTLLDK